MKKNGFCLDFLFAFLWQVVAAAVVFAAEELLLSLLARFAVLSVEFMLYFRAIVLFAGIGILLAVGAWIESYRAGDGGGLYALGVTAGASVLQILTAAVFHFHMALGGATYPIAALLYQSRIASDSTSDWVERIPNAAFWAISFGISAVYLCGCCLLRLSAARRRLSDRKELGAAGGSNERKEE